MRSSKIAMLLYAACIAPVIFAQLIGAVNM